MLKNTKLVAFTIILLLGIANCIIVYNLEQEMNKANASLLPIIPISIVLYVTYKNKMKKILSYTLLILASGLSILPFIIFILPTLNIMSTDNMFWQITVKGSVFISVSGALLFSKAINILIAHK